MNGYQEFIHCYNELIFKELLSAGYIPMKNDYPYIVLNDKNKIIEYKKFENIENLKDKIKFSDKMFF